MLPNGRRAGIGWLLLCVALALPWLLPTHTHPWATFYGEALMALVLLPPAAWAVWEAEGPWKLDALSVAFFLMAVVPVLQALLGMFSLPAEAPLVSLYLTAFALTLLVARHAEEVAPFRLIDSLFAGLAIGAVLSAGIALYQWLGLDWLGVMVASSPSAGRPIANVGQANNLATLMVWGLIAVWWGHTRKSIGGVAAIAAAAVLLMAIALTQSRAGLLEVGMLGLAAWMGRRVLRTSGRVPMWVGLALWFIACQLLLEPLTRAMFQESARSLVDMEAPRQRLAVMEMILAAIWQHPWAGYGWNQIAAAQVSLAGQFSLHVLVVNAHNLVLDLVMWNGLPLAIAAVIGLGAWFWHMVRNAPTAEQLLMVLGLAALMLHAMVELPHVYAYFLLPVAVMMGTLNAQRPIPTAGQVPRVAVGAAIALQAGALVLMFDEYGQIEASEGAAQLRAARIGNRAPPAEPDVFVLRSLQDGLVALRTEPKRGMPVVELEQLRRVVTRYPTPSGLVRFAQASALNSRPADAQWAFQVLCSVHPQSVCQSAVQEWAGLASSDNPELQRVELPPVRGLSAPR